MSRLHLLGAVLLATVLMACSGPEQAPERPSGDPERSAEGSSELPAGVVDSIFPMDVMLARFRDGLAEPAGLAGGTSSLEALVDSFVAAVVRDDPAALEAMAVDRAEFAWLYFPTTSIASPPYELPPDLAWFQVEELNRRDMTRFLAAHGGRAMELQALRCDPEPLEEGRNRIWTHCVLTIGRGADEPVKIQAFGPVIERAGQFKFLNYANDS